MSPKRSSTKRRVQACDSGSRRGIRLIPSYAAARRLSSCLSHTAIWFQLAGIRDATASRRLKLWHCAAQEPQDRAFAFEPIAHLPVALLWHEHEPTAQHLREDLPRLRRARLHHDPPVFHFLTSQLLDALQVDLGHVVLMLQRRQLSLQMCLPRLALFDGGGDVRRGAGPRQGVHEIA